MEFNVTDQIYKRALIHKGDISRILKLIEKAEKGNDITVAFLGGSITQGCNSTVYEKSYVELTYKWFKENFRNIEVKHINAGVGATGSLIGVHRAEQQVLRDNPDIIFVDSAVNDSEEYSCKVAYESLIRKLLSSKNKPAIVEVFMTMNNGYNVQNQQIQIGKRYDVPMISFRDAVYDEVINNKIAITDILTDEVHPNDLGHSIIAQLLCKFINNVYKEDYKKDEQIKIVDNTLELPYVFGDRYINGTILSNLEVNTKDTIGFENCAEGFQVFKNGWKYNSKTNERGRLVIDVEAKNVILLYKKSVSENAGKIEVKINNEEKVIVDSYFKDGWGDYAETQILKLSDEITKYRVEINTVDDSRKKEVTILGVMIS